MISVFWTARLADRTWSMQDRVVVRLPDRLYVMSGCKAMPARAQVNATGACWVGDLLMPNAISQQAKIDFAALS